MKKRKALIIFFTVWFLIMIGIFAIVISQTSKQDYGLQQSGEIGDTLTFDELEVKINSVSFSPFLGGLSGLNKADEGMQYCVVYLNIKNISTTQKELKGFLSNSNYLFVLKYKKDYEYYGTYADYKDFLMAHETIAPLESIDDVCVCFKVPNEVAENSEESLTIVFKINKQNDKNHVEWKLR